MQATVQLASGSFENGPRLPWESAGRAETFRYAPVAIYIDRTISGVGEIATFLLSLWPAIFRNAGCWLPRFLRFNVYQTFMEKRDVM